MHIFISYANAPKEESIVLWISKIVHAAGLRTWIDNVNLRSRSGAALHYEVAEAIRLASPAVLFLASAQSLASNYCAAEIAMCVEIGKPVLTLLIEECSLTGAFLPIRGSKHNIVDLSCLPRSEWERALLEPFASIGIDIMSEYGEPELPSSRLVRPRYFELKKMNENVLTARIMRLQEACRLNLTNGYNALNLAYLLLHRGNAKEALSVAQNAGSLLPVEPSAAMVQALALCAMHPPAKRSNEIVDRILSHLFLAMSMEQVKSPVYLLSTLVVCNFHVYRYLNLPLNINNVLTLGVSQSRLDIEENWRVYETERLINDKQSRFIKNYISIYLGQ